MHHGISIFMNGIHHKWPLFRVLFIIFCETSPSPGVPPIVFLPFYGLDDSKAVCTFQFGGCIVVHRGRMAISGDALIPDREQGPATDWCRNAKCSIPKQNGRWFRVFGCDERWPKMRHGRSKRMFYLMRNISIIH